MGFSKSDSHLSLLTKVQSRFIKTIRLFALFHLFYALCFILELGFFLFGSPFLIKPSLFALMIGLTAFTVFSYLVLRPYFQTQKKEQFLKVREEWIQEMSGRSLSSEDALTNIYQLITDLDGKEHEMYLGFPRGIPLCTQFIAWCFWLDIHHMKELLHMHCIRTQLEKIKKDPLKVDSHLSLAKGYLLFYKLYQFPESSTSPTFYSFMEKAYHSPAMVSKFQKIARCAIEELKIILEYLPNDRWSLTQLASVYEALNEKKEEKEIYEKLLLLDPEELKWQFRLGILHFQLGSMARGLEIYSRLRNLHPLYAEKLINHYEAFYSESNPLNQ